MPSISSPGLHGEEEGGARPTVQFEDGRPLTRPAFVKQVKAALEEVGASSVGVSGNSFRIGAATTAAERGVEDSTVKDMGRWRSNAFQGYIRRNRAKLAELSEVLARPS